MTYIEDQGEIDAEVSIVEERRSAVARAFALGLAIGSKSEGLPASVVLARMQPLASDVEELGTEARLQRLEAGLSLADAFHSFAGEELHHRSQWESDTRWRIQRLETHSRVLDGQVAGLRAHLHDTTEKMADWLSRGRAPLEDVRRAFFHGYHARAHDDDVEPVADVLPIRGLPGPGQLDLDGIDT